MRSDSRLTVSLTCLRPNVVTFGYTLSGNMLLDMPLNFWPNRTLGHSQVKLPLESDPEIRRRPQVPAEPKRHIGCDGALSVDDRANPAWQHMDLAGKPVDADDHRLHELLEQNFPRMYRLQQPFTRHTAPQW
jgi:hypothetical protein